MVFEVEFIVTDTRPLYYGGDENLISFLEPLRKNNQTIVSYANLSYLRQLGKVSTVQKHGRTYFSLQNGIKFPDFNSHQMELRKDLLYYFRENQLRRFLTTETFGTINRLKIGFNLNLYRKEEDGLLYKDGCSQNETLLLLQNLLNITTEVGKGHHRQTMPLNKIGEWLAGTIERATFLKENQGSDSQKGNPNVISWIKKRAEKTRNEKPKVQLEVEHIDTVAIISFYPDEKITIPGFAKKFPTPSVPITGVEEKENEKEPEQDKKKEQSKTYSKKLEIYYFDYSLKPRCKDKVNPQGVENSKDIKANDQLINLNESETVRVYFIRKDYKCSPSYYHAVLRRLLELRVSLVSLENILNKIKLSTYEQDCFLTLMLDNVRDIKNGDLGFLNRTDADCGEIMELKRRREIRDRIRTYRSLILR